MKKVGIAAAVIIGVLVVAAVVAAIVHGLRAHAAPELRVEVVATIEGRSSAEMESSVTAVIEHALVADAIRVESVSTTSSSRVVFVFPPAYDRTRAIADVQTALASVARQLPPGIAPPIARQTFSPQLYAAVSGPYANVRLRELADTLVVDALQRRPGVEWIGLCGGREDGVTVEVDTVRAAAFGVMPLDVASALRAAHPASVDAVGDVAVKAARVRDVAVVARRGPASPCEATFDGALAVVVAIAAVDREAEAAAKAAVLDAAKSAPPTAKIDWLDQPVTVRFPDPIRPGEDRRRLADAIGRRIGRAYAESTLAPDDLREPNALHFPAGKDARAVATTAAEMLAAQGVRFEASWPGGQIDETTIVLSGPDLEVLHDIASKLVDALARVSGVVGPGAVGTERSPELAIEVSKANAARYGVDPALPAQLVGMATMPMRVGAVEEGGRSIPVAVGMLVKDVSDLQLVRIPTSSGVVPLSALATMKSELPPTRIVRVNRSRAALVRFTEWPKADRSAIDKAIASVALPPGYIVTRR